MHGARDAVKVEPQRLDVDAYPFRHELYTRFSDTDAVGHLNNVALLRYYDDVRVRFQLECLDGGPDAGLGPHGWHLSWVEVSFDAETFHGNTIVVASGVLDIGRDHFLLAQAMFQRDECKGTCRSSIVMLDETNHRMDITESRLARLNAHRMRIP
jgi:acyl-CoA thioester hydrolase